MKNVDRSSAQQIAVTVDNVTVMITDYQPKKRKLATELSKVQSDLSDTSSNASNDIHEDRLISDNHTWNTAWFIYIWKKDSLVIITIEILHDSFIFMMINSLVKITCEILHDSFISMKINSLVIIICEIQHESFQQMLS